MALSKQKDRENFLRTAILIVDHVQDSLVSMIELDLTHKRMTFEQFLNSNQHEVFHLYYNKNNKICCQCAPNTRHTVKRILFLSQLELLFDSTGQLPCHTPNTKSLLPLQCCRPAVSHISTNVLDISLARVLLFNLCTDVFWYSCLSFRCITLEDFLNNNKHTIYHLWKGKMPCCQCPSSGFSFPCDNPQISQNQWKSMFSGHTIPCTTCRKRTISGFPSVCSEIAISAISVQQLDPSLQDVLLRFCCPLWKVVTDLVKIRNVQFAHVKEARMTDLEYAAIKQEIHTGLIEISRVCGNEHEVQQKLRDMDLQILDDTLVTRYQTDMLRHIERMNDIRINYDNIGKKIDEQSTNIKTIKNETETISRGVKHLRSNLPRRVSNLSRGMTKCMKSMEISVDKLSNDVKQLEICIPKKIRRCVQGVSMRVNQLEKDIPKTIQENIEELMSKHIEKFDKRIPNVVRDCVSGKENSKRSKLIELTLVEIESHIKENTFILTPAIKACIDSLLKGNVLILTGAAGTGKSRNSLEVLRICKDMKFEVLKLTDLKDFEDVVSVDISTVILIEDVFGRTNNIFTPNTDVQALDRVNACVSNCKIKVIFTIRDIVKRSCDWVLSSHRLFHKVTEVDLSCEELRLNNQQKEQLFHTYCQENNFSFVGWQGLENLKTDAILDPNETVFLSRGTVERIVLTEPLLGFPEACCLFTRNRRFTRLGEAFFKHPSKCLAEEIEQLRIAGRQHHGERIKYATLVYSLLNEDCLNRNQIDIDQVRNIITSCYHSCGNYIVERDVLDAADEMTGRYVTYKPDTSVYQFQHQTILESVLISYSKINPKLILSKLSFDFIREIVRLEDYQEQEGEIVVKIAQKNYPDLVQRLISILETEFSDKSLSFIQLLCDSDIMRQNGRRFIKCLIDESSRRLPLGKSKTIVTYLGRCDLVTFYLPAALLEYLIKQKSMIDSSTQLIEHMSLVIGTSNNPALKESCKTSVYASLSLAADLGKTDAVFKSLLKVIMNNKDITEIKEYLSNMFTSVSNETVMLHLIQSVKPEFIDIKTLFLVLFKRNWLDMLKLVKVVHEPLHLKDVVQSVCEDLDSERVKFFIHKIINISRGVVICHTKKDNDIVEWLQSNIVLKSGCLSDIIEEVCAYGHLDVLHWLVTQESVNINEMPRAFKRACVEGNLEKVKWLANKINPCAINLNDTLLEVCQRNKVAVLKILVETVDYTNFNLDILTSMCRMGKGEIVSILLHIANHFVLPEIIEYMRKACDNGKLDVIDWMLTLARRSLLDMKTALNEACSTDDIHNANWLLENANHSLFDLKQAMQKACFKGSLHIILLLMGKSANRFKLFEMMVAFGTISEKEKIYIIKSLIKNFDHSLIELRDTIYKACEVDRIDIVKLLLLNFDNDMFDLKKWLFLPNENCRILKFLLQTVNRQLLDIQLVIMQACERGWLNTVKVVLDHAFYNNISLDMKSAMHCAFHHGKLNVVMWFVINIEHVILQIDLDNGTSFKTNELRTINFFMKYIDWCSSDIKDMINKALETDNDDILHYIAVEDNPEILQCNSKDFIFKFCESGNADTFIWLIEYVIPTDFNLNDAIQKACVAGNKDIIEILMHRTYQNRVDKKTTLNMVCRGGHIDIVKWLVTTFDRSVFDMATAVAKAAHERQGVTVNWLVNNCLESRQWLQKTFRQMKINYSTWRIECKWLLEIVDNTLFDVEIAMDYACCRNELDIVKWLLENVEHTLFDMTAAMNEACEGGSLDIVKWLRENFEHTLFDMKTAMNKACEGGSLDIVEWLRENVEHTLFDMTAAMNEACEGGSLDIVKWLRENFEHTLFDMKTAMNKACEGGSLDIVKWLRENFEHTLFDMKSATNAAFEGESQDTLEMLLENIDITPSILNVVSGNIFSTDNDDSFIDNERVLLSCLEKVHGKGYKISDISDLIEHSCSRGYLQVVQNLIENVDHSSININKALVRALHSNHGETNEDIIELILQFVDHSQIDFKTLMEGVSRCGFSKLVHWIIINKETILFNMKHVLNEACHHGDLELVEWILKRYDEDIFDIKSAMNKACRGNNSYQALQMCQWMWNNVNRQELDLDTAMNNACRHGNTEIVKWILTLREQSQFDLQAALINACCHGHMITVEWMLANVNNDLFDIDKTIVDTCSRQNDDDDNDVLEIIQLLISSTDRSSIDETNVISIACKNYHLNIVNWLIETSDCVRNVRDVINFVLDIDTNGHNDRETKERQDAKRSLVLLVLKRTTFSDIDLESVVTAVCKHGWLDVLKWIWEHEDQIDIDIRRAINVACENGGIEIVEWSLNELFKRNLDLNTIMCESCGYGWLEIVKKIWNEFNPLEHVEIDIKSSLNEAYFCGREQVVIWLIENVDWTFVDLNVALTEACKHGWVDITKRIIGSSLISKATICLAISESCTCGHINIVELMFDKFGGDFFDITIITPMLCTNTKCEEVANFLLTNIGLKGKNLSNLLLHACSCGWINVVKWILDHESHIKFNMAIALDNSCINGEVEIVRMILEKCTHSYLDVSSSFVTACNRGWDEIVSYILDEDSVDKSQLDMTKALVKACREGESDIVQLISSKVGQSCFELNTIYKVACSNQMNEDLVVWMLKHLDNKDVDTDFITMKSKENEWWRVPSFLKKYNAITMKA